MSSSCSSRFCVIEPNNSEGYEEFSNPREELNRYKNFLCEVWGWLADFIEILNKAIIQKKESVNWEKRFKCISLWEGGREEKHKSPTLLAWSGNEYIYKIYKNVYNVLYRKMWVKLCFVISF